jgi:hypothetical protein
MEALIFEILVTSAATLFAVEKYTQFTREKSFEAASKKVPSNENIKVINLQYVSVFVPASWGNSTNIESVAEIELLGSYDRVRLQVRQCLNALQGEVLLIEEGTIIYKFQNGIFSSPRMLKLILKETENNRCRLHIEASVYDRNFQIRTDKINRRDEYALKAFVTLLNASCVSTAELVCDTF